MILSVVEWSVKMSVHGRSDIESKRASEATSVERHTFRVVGWKARLSWQAIYLGSMRGAIKKRRSPYGQVEQSAKM